MTSAGDDLAPLKKALADLLAARRATAGITQKELARAISYGRTTVATAESGHRQPAGEFWTACDEVLGADGDLTRAYEQLAAGRRQRTEQRVQAERLRRGAQPEMNPSTVVGIRHGVPTARFGAPGSALATVTSADSRAIGTAANLVSGVAARRIAGRGGGAEFGATAIAGGRFFDGAIIQTLTLTLAAVEDGTPVTTVPAAAMDYSLPGPVRCLLVSTDGSDPRNGLSVSMSVLSVGRCAGPGVARSGCRHHGRTN